MNVVRETAERLGSTGRACDRAQIPAGIFVV